MHQAQGVPEPRLAHLAAEDGLMGMALNTGFSFRIQAGAKIESELQADFNRAREVR